MHCPFTCLKSNKYACYFCHKSVKKKYTIIVWFFSIISWLCKVYTYSISAASSVYHPIILPITSPASTFLSITGLPLLAIDLNIVSWCLPFCPLTYSGSSALHQCTALLCTPQAGSTSFLAVCCNKTTRWHRMYIGYLEMSNHQLWDWIFFFFLQILEVIVYLKNNNYLKFEIFLNINL